MKVASGSPQASGWSVIIPVKFFLGFDDVRNSYLGRQVAESIIQIEVKNENLEKNSQTLWDSGRYMDCPACHYPVFISSNAHGYE